MGIFDFFSSPPSSTLPDNIVSMMEHFGRKSFYPTDASIIFNVWGDCLEHIYPLAQKDSESFINDLADAVLPVGGWTVYGAERVLGECGFHDANIEMPAYHAIFADALQFLRDNGVPPMWVNGYEWSYWHKTKGKTEPWLSARARPTPENAPISELQPNEQRRIVQFTSNEDSNISYVQKLNDQEYVYIIDSRKSSEDPQRVLYESYKANSLYEIYLKIGEGLQIPCYWVHDELEPYFPFPRPKITCSY